MSDRTKLTLAPTIAAGTIDHLADAMWDNLAGTYEAVVTLEVCERTEPSDTETERKAKLRVVGIEIPATKDGHDQLRKQRRAMYADRTGKDTLMDPDT